MAGWNTCRKILEWKNFLIVFLTPVILSPILILGEGSSVSQILLKMFLCCFSFFVILLPFSWRIDLYMYIIYLVYKYDVFFFFIHHVHKKVNAFF